MNSLNVRTLPRGAVTLQTPCGMPYDRLIGLPVARLSHLKTSDHFLPLTASVTEFSSSPSDRFGVEGARSKVRTASTNSSGKRRRMETVSRSRVGVLFLPRLDRQIALQT